MRAFSERLKPIWSLRLATHKKRPQPGEDGYGRLVRVQQGRGGDDGSRALERQHNAGPGKGFRSMPIGAFGLAERQSPPQILFRGKDLGVGENYELPAGFSIGDRRQKPWVSRPSAPLFLIV